MARFVVTLPAETSRNQPQTRTVEIVDGLTVGRGPHNHVQVLDRQASKDHFHIERRGDAWILRDLGSMNGTWIANRRVHHVRIFDGDEILVGSVRLRFEDPGGPPRPFAVAELASGGAPAATPAYQLRPSAPTPVHPLEVTVAAQPAPREHARRDAESQRTDHDRLRRFYDLVVALVATRDVPEVLALVGERLREGAEILRVALYVTADATDGDGELRAYSTWVHRAAGDLPPVSENAIDHVLTERAALLMHRGSASQRGGASASGVGLSLLVDAAPLGVLWLDARGFWDLKPADLDYLLVVGQQVARTLDALMLRDRLAAARQLQ